MASLRSESQPSLNTCETFFDIRCIKLIHQFKLAERETGWALVLQQTIQRLFRSMRHMLQAMVNERGSYTGY